MYYKLNNGDMKVYNQVVEHTCTDYDLTGNFLPVENMFSMVEDLLNEIHNLEEKLIDITQEVEENYELKKTDLYQEYGVSERDFM